MKLLDDVEVLNDNYNEYGIKKGMIGTIIDADIRWNSFFVNFQDQRVYDSNFMKDKNNIFKLKSDICHGIKLEDLKLIKEGNATDELIEKSLPDNHKDWWCKVEDGYIMNLLGEKKNKIPYQYNS